MQLLNQEQQALLNAVDGVRNVREIALLLGSTDEQILFELRQLATLEIINWSAAPTPVQAPPAQGHIPSMRHTRTPLPLRGTYPNHTQHAQRTISSIGSAQNTHFGSAQDTQEQQPRIPSYTTEDSVPGTPYPTRPYVPAGPSSSFIKKPALQLMDWEEVCIPAQPNQAGRPQHHLPPPSTLTPLPIYRPTPPPRKSGPFTPASSSTGFKPTIKKK